jgi:uncharacterized repeat protein (TIGR03987 family)
MARLFVAITLMLLALTCYTIGVWGEYLARKLSRWHVAFFWMGLFFDSLGTHTMFRIDMAASYDILVKSLALN